MSFIVGQDISEFQGQIDWQTYKQNTNFVIIKAGEGVGYIDKWFGYNRLHSRQLNIPRGFYHFARPDLGNTPEQEANFFCNLIDGDPILPGEVLALDYEVTYSDPVGWCKTWLDMVYTHFNGIKPLIYLDQSDAQKYDWTPVIEAGYGLWIACYTYDPTVNAFQGGKWQTAVMQQWTDKQIVPGISGDVDGDCFFGTVGQFIDYGFIKPDVVLSTKLPDTPIPQPDPVVSVSSQNETTPPPDASVEPATPVVVPTGSIDPVGSTFTITPTQTPTQTVIHANLPTPPQSTSFFHKLIRWLESFGFK